MFIGVVALQGQVQIAEVAGGVPESSQGDDVEATAPLDGPYQLLHVSHALHKLSATDKA